MAEFGMAGDFPAAERSQWLELVERVLGDRDFARTLVSRTHDGLPIEPLYGQRDPGSPVAARAGRWVVFQRVDHPDIAEANQLALLDLEGGADGLELIFPGSVRGSGFGIGAESLADLDRLLGDIDLATTPLRIDAGYETRNVMACIAALAVSRGVDPSKVDIVGMMDPVTGLLTTGRLIAGYEQIGDHCADATHAIRRRGLNIRPFSVDVRGVHAAGGSSGQELAYALADALAIMRELEERDIAADQAAASLSFIFAVDVDQFASIAKLRAFRLLWARVLELCGIQPSRPRVHAQTAWRMMTRRDPWVNILRTTVATAAAGLGGADSVTVLPFTLAAGLPDGFARRIARNIQLVLLEESGLGRVADPAGGSGYVEALTGQLCEKAWTLFQEIEREGGLFASVESGAFQKRVLQVREKRIADAATRRDPILGVSEYPRLDEVPVTTLTPPVEALRMAGMKLDMPPPRRGEHFDALVEAVSAGATFADMATSIDAEWTHAPGLHSIRLAEPYELLRDASDAALEATGRRPSVFLATLGGPSEFTARASWARNAFEAGGIEALGGVALETLDDMIAAFRVSRAELACICGTDAKYAEAAGTLAAALKEVGARTVYLAGRPGPQEAELRAAGVDAFLFAGCDILSELTAAHARLGLAPAVPG